jgi:hypothetical protein
MAATTAAVVAEEDTELRDLLVQTLENSGVLNRIKVRQAAARARGRRVAAAAAAARGGATRRAGRGGAGRASGRRIPGGARVPPSAPRAPHPPPARGV